MPAATAAGRMPRCRIMSGEYGCLPFMRGLPKTQSSTSEMATVRTQAQPRSQSLSRALSVSRSPRFAAWAVWERLCWPTNMFGAPPVRKNPAVMPSTKLSVVLLRTSFGFQPNCHPSLPILSRRKSAPLSEEERRFTFEKSDVYANPYPLRLFADRLGNSSDPAVTVRTNLSSSRILVLDPVLSRLLYFGAFAFILLSHSHL